MTEQDAATSDDNGSAEEEASKEDRSAEDVDEMSIDDESPVSEDIELDDIDADLVDYVAETDDEELARELGSLRVRVEGLDAELRTREDEIEELTAKLKRKQADFENYKKRTQKRREEEKRRATEDLVVRLLDVRDNLRRALDQDEDADIRDGVEATLRELDRVLEDENVDVVEPQPGDDVDPQRHEVLLGVESDRPEGTVVDVHRPGYEMAEKVIREAQVTVSEGPSAEDQEEQADGTGEQVHDENGEQSTDEADGKSNDGDDE